MSSNANFKLRCSNKFLLSLILIVILFTSCLVSTFSDVSSFAFGAPDKIVNNETELRTAVNTTTRLTVIALASDISLSSTLIIPTGKDITLTSNSANEFYKLIGAQNVDTIETKGLLRLDGIIIAHANNVFGRGVSVNFGGTLIMSDGEISNNKADGGGGVINYGHFSMLGGKISNNNGYLGGGVYNVGGLFEMLGGKIGGNSALHGGGVNNNGGKFSLIGGEVFNNTANYGGGVNNYKGVFVMSGGKVSNNTTPLVGFSGNAGFHGGGVHNNGNFTMLGGEVSGNIAALGSGGGVYNSNIFSMSGGEISNNQAANDGTVYIYPHGNGGGVFNGSNFSLSGNGTIYSNKAEIGGGVYNAGVFYRRDGIVSGNTAAQYKDIYSHNGVGELPDENDGSSDDNWHSPWFIGASFVGAIVVIIGSWRFCFCILGEKRERQRSKSNTSAM